MVDVLEEMRGLLTDGKGKRRDLLFRPDSGSASLGFHYHEGEHSSDFKVQSLIAGGPAHISGQINRGDVILAVDNVEVTADTVEACFSSSQYIGSCASMRLKRESNATEVLLVRSPTSHLRSMQILFGYLDALEKAILDSGNSGDPHVAFEKLLAYIVEMERKRSQNEMEVASQLATLQARLVQSINTIESMVRPAPQQSAVRPSSSAPESANGVGSPLATGRAHRFGSPTSTDSSSPTPRRALPNSADMIVKLDLNSSVPGAAESEQRKAFVRNVQSDLAKATNATPDVFMVNSVSPGSIILNITVLVEPSSDQNPHAMVADLKKQADDPKSVLRSGVLTRYVDRIELLSPPSTSDLEKLRDELARTKQLLEDANTAVTSRNKINQDLQLSLDHSRRQADGLEQELGAAKAALESPEGKASLQQSQLERAVAEIFFYKEQAHVSADRCRAESKRSSALRQQVGELRFENKQIQERMKSEAATASKMCDQLQAIAQELRDVSTKQNEKDEQFEDSKVSHYTELENVRQKLLRVEREYDDFLQEFSDSGLGDPAQIDSMLLAVKGPPSISPEELIDMINAMRRFQVTAKDVESMKAVEVNAMQQEAHVQQLSMQQEAHVQQLEKRIEQLQQEVLDVKQHDAFMTRMVEELQAQLRTTQEPQEPPNQQLHVDKLANMYEQRIENLQNENDQMRSKALTQQIEIDQLRDQLAHFDSLVPQLRYLNTELEAQVKAQNAKADTLREDNRQLAEKQAKHDTAVGKCGTNGRDFAFF